MGETLAGRVAFVSRSVFSPMAAVLRDHCQTFTVQVEVDRGEVRPQPVVVLGEASISHLVEAEEPLQDAKRMFEPSPYARLTSVLLFL